MVHQNPNDLRVFGRDSVVERGISKRRDRVDIGTPREQQFHNMRIASVHGFMQCGRVDSGRVDVALFESKKVLWRGSSPPADISDR